MSEKKALIDHIPSPTSLEIYHIGPHFKEGALPSLIYFALSGEESLSLDPFDQPINCLKNTPIRKFSFTLPFHGAGYLTQDAMANWSREFASNNNFLTPYIEQVSQNIDFLIESGYINPKKIAVAGLSRGGLIATHVALKNSKISIILGFAPLTEFGWMSQNTSRISESFNLSHYTKNLVGKSVRFYIGNRDLRVGTSLCYKFIEQLTEDSYNQGIRSPQAEIIIYPSIGHKGHGTPPEIFQSGAEWVKSKLISP